MRGALLGRIATTLSADGKVQRNAALVTLRVGQRRVLGEHTQHQMTSDLDREKKLAIPQASALLRPTRLRIREEETSSQATQKMT